MSKANTGGVGDPDLGLRAGSASAAGNLATYVPRRHGWTQVVLQRGGWLRLELQMPTGSMSEGDTAWAGEPVRGALVGLASGLLMSSSPRAATAGAGGPARAVPAGLLGAPARQKWRNIA
ncbi:MAG: hypothetical protein ACRC7D_17205 [Aeromonas popoffii]|uniref:hypothetical protein n=1 Tax=Aeromonas popoffii TaxID=70856 RepID=UPI003F3C8BD3